MSRTTKVSRASQRFTASRRPSVSKWMPENPNGSAKKKIAGGSSALSADLLLVVGDLVRYNVEALRSHVNLDAVERAIVAILQEAYVSGVCVFQLADDRQEV